MLITGRDPKCVDELARAMDEAKILCSTLAFGRSALPATLDDALREVAAIVHLVTPGGTSAPLVELDGPGWEARCEAIILEALHVLQAGHRAFRARGGHIVVVVPNIGIAGCAELVPYVTAVEAVRALAKSAARQWGQLGVVIGTLVVPLGVLRSEAPELVRLAPPAAGRAATLDEIANAVSFLASAGPGATGTTMIVDGGSVMAP